MGRIEIHPRTFSRNRNATPTAERRFVETPDVDVNEQIPVLGEVHPEFAAMTCVRVNKTSGYNNDPQQTLWVASYEHVVT